MKNIKMILKLSVVNISTGLHFKSRYYHLMTNILLKSDILEIQDKSLKDRLMEEIQGLQDKLMSGMSNVTDSIH